MGIRSWLVALVLAVPMTALAATPEVGQQAPDFTLATPAGTNVDLHSLTSQARTVLVVLRGYPGYQCPFCQKQLQDFIAHAEDFAKAHAQVLLVYPGPRAALDQRAKEFLDNKTLPANMHLVVDPDYRVTNLYGLRWDAPHETAYPTTFILNRGGKVAFRKISHEHGDRLSGADALQQLAALPAR